MRYIKLISAHRFDATSADIICVDGEDILQFGSRNCHIRDLDHPRICADGRDILPFGSSGNCHIRDLDHPRICADGRDIVPFGAVRCYIRETVTSAIWTIRAYSWTAEILCKSDRPYRETVASAAIWTIRVRIGKFLMEDLLKRRRRP